MESTGLQPADSTSLNFHPIKADDHSEHLTRGAAADIWKVTRRHGGTPISYISKVLRVSPGDFNSIVGITRDGHDSQYRGTKSWAAFSKMYQDKVAQWARLSHANIVRVYDLQDNLNLRVEFCHYGSVRDCFKAGIGARLNKGGMVSGLLAGLEHLHSKDRSIVHGNLNAGKLFVDAAGQIKIGEFGLTALCYDIAPLVPSVVFVGMSRWTSPELFKLNDDGSGPLPSFDSDIWALGCTIYEIISEQLPYAKHKNDVKVQKAILKGEFPGNRPEYFEEIYKPEFWSTIESCWSPKPPERPRATAILEQLPTAQKVLRGDTFTLAESAGLTRPYEEQRQPPVGQTLDSSIQRPSSYVNTWLHSDLQDLGIWGGRQDTSHPGIDWTTGESCSTTDSGNTALPRQPGFAVPDRIPHSRAEVAQGVTAPQIQAPLDDDAPSTLQIIPYSPANDNAEAAETSTESWTLVPGQKVCPVPQCGRSFKRPSLPKAHMHTHGGPKRHKCAACDASFASKSGLRRHDLEVHDRVARR